MAAHPATPLPLLLLSPHSRAWPCSGCLPRPRLAVKFGFSGCGCSPPFEVGSWLPSRKAIVCSASREEESDTADDVTRRFGLEAGLWKIFSSKDEHDGTKETKRLQAKDLLARYGGAYLATSISLSLVSFGLCYVLVSSGVNVASLLEKIGIHSNETGEKVGTFALAYAAHKAASPIRFPPTVALTPIVAGWFGKRVSGSAGKSEL